MKPKLTIKVKKSEKPKVAAQGIPPSEPPMIRTKEVGSATSEKTLGEHLLASFEKLEAEEVEKVKETAAKAKTTPQPKARSKSKKIQDPEYMETEDIEGPASGQITPGEVSLITDAYTVDMSMEEIRARVTERVRQFQTTKALLEQQKQWELE